ncbi:MAG: hypothetical protein A2X04_07050 [Bacteroidetes bacterium GWF2_41_9]|nr:MAG: hypothetical protein A2X04_07050 [Bacteroidetes bacterium GWF2_41_9]HAM09230.1 hypothetical protein [Bacteroidales bacterium]
MRRIFSTLLLVSQLLSIEAYSQEHRFVVKRATFSSGLDDEFSPVFFNNGLVFCSNLRDNSLVGYKDGGDRLFKIVYVNNKSKSGWKPPVLLAKELTTGFNDGPATFDTEGTIIYFSRNNYTGKSLRNISDTTNKLGIFRAEMIDGLWSAIEPCSFNDPLYNFYTPSLSPDGSRIYFSSDMPGGFGGMDLYYCDTITDGWKPPVNLGPEINTAKNETFPFAARYGILYFTSDGHEGFGGKDLYYTREISGKWIYPVHLDSAINSPADDFGLVTDSTLEKGYFSTNRLKTDDIFSFTTAPVEFSSCDSIQENKYCFTFYDEQHKLIDTVPVTYRWDFGDSIIVKGVQVKHCFPGPGKYSVKLSIYDELTGDAIADQVNYDVVLEEIEQAQVKSQNIGFVDNSLSFEGVLTGLKGIQVTDYYWDFGTGFEPGGPLARHSFKKKGEYFVRLGLTGEADSLGQGFKKCIMKKIRIFDSFREMETRSEIAGSIPHEKIDTAGGQLKTLGVLTYFMDDLSERQKTNIRAKLSGNISHELNFFRNGLLTSSNSILQIIYEVLKEDPDIRLEMSVYANRAEFSGGKMEISEMWAQEVTYWFRNNEISMEVLNSSGYGLARSPFRPVEKEDKTKDGVIEFAFMKN